MPKRDIVVIGASAGGVEAVAQLVGSLPADFPASVFVVVHFPPHSTSVLPQILNRRGPLVAAHARDGEPIRTGHIYVAPPNHHLLVHRGFVRVVHGPEENGHQPAVDPLFRSAARAFGARTVGIVLSGYLDDGTAGLMAIKARGGVALVQYPEEALADGMPRSAIENVAVDHVLPIAELAAVLPEIVRETVDESTPPPRVLEWETETLELEWEPMSEDSRPGDRAALSCPACGGTLWEFTENDLIRFRCRVGHGFTAETLLAKQAEVLEDAFWIALRALEERASLARRLAERARKRGLLISAERFDRQVEESENRANVIRNVLLQRLLPSAEGHPRPEEVLPPDQEAGPAAEEPAQQSLPPVA